MFLILSSEDKKSRFGISAGIGYDAGVCQEVLATPFKKIFNRLHLGKLIYLFIALKQLIFISSWDNDGYIWMETEYFFTMTMYILRQL